MTQAAQEEGLPALVCLQRLGRSRIGYLACSDRALPSVLPVSVRLTGTRLLLTAPNERFARLLLGQLVAVGAGRPPGILRDGWQVIVRGQVDPVAGMTRTVSLDPQDVAGSVLRRVPALA